MSTTNIKLHYYQIELVKKLSQAVFIRFNDLIIKGLESEHMNYHLKKLINLGFVQKMSSKYTLTDIGKDYSKRKNPKGQVEHLLSKRLRQPYFGKVGHPTGKVKFGEKVQEAAERELFEETGLKAKKFYLERIYRKMRKKDGLWVQDVIFFIFLVKDLSSKLIAKTPLQENFWISGNALKKRASLDLYDDFTLDDHMTPKPLTFTEISAEAKGF